jgi:putative S-methylcysteine transport system ATP-binding protein
MIRVEGLTKRFGDHTVLDGIDLAIAPGDRIVIIGPSGTGKSTLLRCLNFLDRPDAGRITLGDLTVDAAHASRRDILALRRRTAFVFQNYALFANRTARQNITEALTVVKGIPRAEADARADAILGEIGLADRADAWPAALSGGQQQRVGIGRAMALHAELMLVDEPTSALDPEWVGEVLDLLRRVAQHRQTMLIVTHEMQFAREIADRVLFMDGGRIVEQGPPATLFETPRDPRLQAFLRRVA